ncbi:MAG: response regulator [Cyanobacteria bacterium P01_A01_bin.135]
MTEKAKILAVDDVAANLEVIVGALSSEGYKVATATSGYRALKRLEVHRADLILLDVKMQGMDGFQVCQQLKANPETADIPVIFITALSDTSSISRGFALGAVDYVAKPFREVELLARVNTHIQLRQSNQTLEKRVQERTCELEELLSKLEKSQLQLIKQEKMSALGNLVAGVAHEINNPVSCVSGNIAELKRNLADIFTFAILFQSQASVEEQKKFANKIDLDFLLEDVPKMMASMENACDRILDISRSLRSFSRMDRNKTLVNLHEGLESTLLILSHRLKANHNRPKIEVIKHYGDLPEVYCFSDGLNQVLMNLLVNAIDAVEDSNRGKSYSEVQACPNQITLKTACADHQVSIGIKDNGVGMPDDVKKRIFDPLYTTKDVNRGTGLGLAIVKQIIEEDHGGRIRVESTVGKGTEFMLWFPAR